jgi:hypothetical protein
VGKEWKERSLGKGKVQKKISKTDGGSRENKMRKIQKKEVKVKGGLSLCVQCSRRKSKGSMVKVKVKHSHNRPCRPRGVYD